MSLREMAIFLGQDYLLLRFTYRQLDQIRKHTLPLAQVLTSEESE